jgi:hypothetical protein
LSRVKLRRPGWWIAGLALLVAEPFGTSAVQRHLARTRAKTAWLGAQRCLTGGAPSVGETPSSVVRRIELGVAARRLGGAPDRGDDTWPMRCADPVRDLDAAWGALREDAAIRKLTEGIVNDATYHDVARDPAELDRLFERARELDAIDADEPSITPAPRPATLLRFGDLPPYSASGRLVATEPWHGRPARFRVEDAVCMIGATDDPRTNLLEGHCDPLAPFLRSPASSLTPSDDVVPPRISLDHPEHGGVFAVEGAESLLASKEPAWLGAFVSASGAVTTLDRPVVQRGGVAVSGPDHELLTRQPDGTTTRQLIDAPRAHRDDYLAARVVGDQLVWMESFTDHGYPLRARAIRDAAPRLGPIVEIGTVPPGMSFGSTPTVCRTSEALSLMLPGTDRDAVLVVKHGDTWEPPVAVDAWGEVSCVHDEVTWTSVAPFGVERNEDGAGPLVVRQTRCSKGQCALKQIALPTIISTHRAIADQKIVAMDIAGSVALAWIDGGLFYRFATIEALGEAPVRAIADADPRKTKDGGVYHLGGIPRGDAGVLLVNDDHGGHALRIDARGEILPIAFK